MGKAYRQGRLSEEIKKIISDMLLRDIKDPRLKDRLISITAAEVTSDGSYATVYVSLLGDLSAEGAPEEEKAEVLSAFRSVTGLIRRELGKRLKIRRVPELVFKIDESMEYGRHIQEIIDGLGIEAADGDEAAADGGYDE